MARSPFREPWKVRRPASSPGAGLLAFLLFVVGATACGSPSDRPPEVSADERVALGLRSDAEIHHITLGGRGSEEHAVPTRVEAKPGDAVEFRTVDHRVHTVVFSIDSMDGAGRAFLERTNQLASPPLVSRGSRFIVRFQDAPPGRYPFEATGHGGKARGAVEIGAQSTDPAETGGGP